MVGQVRTNTSIIIMWPAVAREELADRGVIIIMPLFLFP